MSAPSLSKEDSLRETVSLLTEMSKLLAGALQDLDIILVREAAGAIGPAEALATMRAIKERHYAEDATEH